jgi:hypothetical protein
VKLADTVKSFKEIVEGKHDELPEQAFYMVGDIGEAMDKAKKLREALSRMKLDARHAEPDAGLRRGGRGRRAGVRGYFGVLPGHAPLLTTLGSGEVTYRSARRDHAAGGRRLRRGAARPRDHPRRVAEAPEEIDRARAERGRQRAELRLSGRHPQGHEDEGEIDFESRAGRPRARPGPHHGGRPHPHRVAAPAASARILPSFLGTAATSLHDPPCSSRPQMTLSS